MSIKHEKNSVKERMQAPETYTLILKVRELKPFSKIWKRQDKF